MKFDIKKYAPLQLLSGVPLSRLGITADAQTLQIIKDSLHKGAPAQVYGISSTFLESVINTYDKVFSQISNLIPLLENKSEVLLYLNGRSTYYQISDEWICFITFIDTQLESVIALQKKSIKVIPHPDNSGWDTVEMLPFFSYHYQGKEKEKQARTFSDISSMNILIMLFKQFCDVEEVVLYPKQQKMFNTAYVKNISPFKITMLDSSWLNTLVKSDAFKVRGHFRLQPHGEGRNKRKLIWISDFEKEGYTRIAGKLKEEESKK